MNPFQRSYFSRTLRQQPEQRASAAVPNLSECGTVCLLCRYGTEPEMLREWEAMKLFHSEFQVVLFYEGKPYQGLQFIVIDQVLDVHKTFGTERQGELC